MTTHQLKRWQLATRFLFFLFLYLIVSPLYAQATGQVTAQSMLENIATQIPALMQMVTGIAYVSGMYMIIQGIIKMKHLGESRTMMSQEHGWAQPVIYISVGALLIYTPTAVNVGLSTFWTDPNPYGYTELQGQWSEFLNVVFLIVQFIGTIAFIRGLLILNQLGSHGGGQGAWSKGLTYILAGIFCINIYQTIQVIFATLGIPLPA